MRFPLYFAVIVSLAPHMAILGQETDLESLPSLRTALVQNYEAMAAINAKLKAAKEEFEAAESLKRVESIDLLTKIAKKEISSGSLEEAKKTYTRVIELSPYNKDAEQFFMATGAGGHRTSLIVDRLKKNCIEHLRALDLKRAKTYLAAANDVSPDDEKIDAMIDGIESLEKIKSAIVDDKSAIVDNKPLVTDSGPLKTVWQANGGGSKFVNTNDLEWTETFTNAKRKVEVYRYNEVKRIGNFVELADLTNAARKVRIHEEGILYLQMPGTAWMETYQGAWLK